MRDLYEILGVDKTATTEEISAAYRSKAKTAHPDAGGSAEAFDEIRIAKEVLSDPERRSTYDQTGHYGDDKPESWERAASVIATVLTRIMSSNVDLESMDLAESLRDGCFLMKKAILKDIENEKKKLEMTERILSRFKTSSPNDVILTLKNRTIDAMKQKIAMMEQRSEDCDAAAAIAEAYTYNFTTKLTYWSTSTSATSTTRWG